MEDELNERQWARVLPLLPPQKPALGRPSIDHRAVLNAILWTARTGTPWRELPPDAGVKWKTASSRFYRWVEAGVFQKVLEELKRDADEHGGIGWGEHLSAGAALGTRRLAAKAKRSSTPSAPKPTPEKAATHPAPREGAGAWQLVLLGVPRLVGPAGPVRLERRTAAVLAYLALEGGGVKSRLAGLLWPDSPDAARANFRQLLRRLRLAAGTDLITGGEVVRLLPDVAVDALEALALAFEERHAELAAKEGELLQGLEFDDAPDLAEWLAGERERLLTLRRRAAGQEAARREQEGDLAGALEFAALGARLEPLSEDAQRAVMRLHYLLGDRGAALAAYGRYRAGLREALGVEPLEETQALAAEIERGTIVPASHAPRPAIPLSVLRPPVLAGREELWRRMEAAWAGGQTILLAGEPGAGKTRLATDFAASKGTPVRLEARPGDAGIPYATAARVVRRLLEHLGEAARGLPDWARGELARLAPELGPAPGALSSDADKLRFFEAVVELHRLQGNAVCILDDVQFADAATVELAGYTLHALAAAGPAPRFIDTFRSGELGAEAAEVVQGLVDAGVAVLIEVPPLDERGVAELLGGLELPQGEELAGRLARYTGGNPLFVVETLKHLFETGLLGRGFPERLPPPERVGAVLGRRLGHLSREALGAARAAAVLRSDFDLELVAQVLCAPLLEAMGAWEELAAAGIVRENGFGHDLVHDAVEASIPEAVRGVLHRSAARALATRGESPARVARHWREGGEPGRAAPLLLEAADAAGRFLRFEEAMGLFEQAANLFEAGGEPEAAFEARAAVFERLWLHDLRGSLDAPARRLLADARTPDQQARAHLAQAVTLLVQQRHAQAAEAAALRGLAVLPPSGGAPHPVRAELLRLLIETRTQQGRPEATSEAIEEAQLALEDAPDAKSGAMLDLSVGAALLRLWRDERALGHLERAARALEELGDPYGASYARSLAAATLEELGRREQAARLRSLVEEGLGTVRRAGAVRYWNTVRLGANLTHRHRYAEALEKLELARQLRPEANRPAGPLDRAFVDLYWVLGALAECDAAADRALADPEPSDVAWCVPWRRKGQVLAQLGRPEEARRAFDRADGVLTAAGLDSSYSKGMLYLHRAAFAPPGEALALVERALWVAGEGGYEELRTAALTVRAEALLACGQVAQALEASQEAALRFGTFPPRDDPAWPLLVHHRVLAALDDPSAPEPLARAAAWLDEMLARHVPPQYAETFSRRPTNATVRALAARHGLAEVAGGVRLAKVPSPLAGEG